MFSTIGKTPEQIEQERMAMMQGQQARPAVAQHANMDPREPGVGEQFATMAKKQVMGDALTKGTKMAYEKGGEMFDKITADPLTTTSTPVPTSTQMTALQSAAPTATAPMAPAATMGVSPGAAQAVLGSSTASAPAVANAAGMTGTQLAGATGAQLAGTGAATAGAGGAGMMAGMAAAAPYVAAGLAADELLGLGLRENILGFEEGGEVEYKDMGGMMGLGPLALKKMQDEGMKSGGLLGMAMMNAGGPVNKIEYKGDGGEVRLHYGPLAKG